MAGTRANMSTTFIARLGSALAAIERNIEHEKCMGFDMFDLLVIKSNMSNHIHFSCSMSCSIAARALP